MKAVDTNILARIVLQDDLEQTEQAYRAISQPVWVSSTVLLELGWVLEKKIKLSRAIVSDALDALLSINTLHLADREGMMWAIARYHEGADWADMVHLVTTRGAADAFLTFDKAMTRKAGDGTPLRVETLA